MISSTFKSLGDWLEIAETEMNSTKNLGEGW